MFLQELRRAVGVRIIARLVLPLRCRLMGRGGFEEVHELIHPSQQLCPKAAVSAVRAAHAVPCQLRMIVYCAVLAREFHGCVPCGKIAEGRAGREGMFKK